jgi:hypothetical protein
MWELTRRRFLTRTSVVGVGIAAAGAGVTALTLPSATTPRSNPGPVPARGPDGLHPAPMVNIALDELAAGGPMLLHVRDFATAEIAVLYGGQEFIYKDPELIARVVQAARTTAVVEG